MTFIVGGSVCNILVGVVWVKGRSVMLLSFWVCVEWMCREASNEGVRDTSQIRRLFCHLYILLWNHRASQRELIPYSIYAIQSAFR